MLNRTFIQPVLSVLAACSSESLPLRHNAGTSKLHINALGVTDDVQGVHILEKPGKSGKFKMVRKSLNGPGKIREFFQ